MPGLPALHNVNLSECGKLLAESKNGTKLYKKISEYGSELFTSVKDAAVFKQIEKIKLNEREWKTVINNYETGEQITHMHTLGNGSTGKYGTLKHSVFEIRKSLKDLFNFAKRDEKIVNVYEGGICEVKKTQLETAADGMVNGFVATKVTKDRNLIDGACKVYLDGECHDVPIIKLTEG